MLDLRAELFAIYVRDHNLYKAKQMMDCFEHKDKDGAFKLWKMSEYQKYCYARYLGLIGEHSMLSLANFEIVISYPTKALKILDSLDGETNYSIKFNFLSHISVAYIFLGEIKLAEEFIQKAEQLVIQGVISKMIYL